MYNKKVLDHFQNPRNFEEMSSPDAKGIAASRVCGDIMTLFLKIKFGKILKASYKTRGCGAAIASGSVLTEILKGKSLDQAKEINAHTLIQELGDLPKIKHHCPDLAVEALSRALKTLDKHSQPHSKIST